MQHTSEEMRKILGAPDDYALKDIFRSFNIRYYKISQDEQRIKIPIELISNIEELQNQLKQVKTPSRKIFNTTVTDKYLIIPTNNYRVEDTTDLSFFECIKPFMSSFLMDLQFNNNNNNNNNNQQKFFQDSSHLPKTNSHIEPVQKSHDKDTEIPSDYECPLTLSIMEDPVLCTLDGYTYERKAIEQSLRLFHRSPLTNSVMKKNQSIEDVLVINRNLKNLIDDFRKNNPQLFDEKLHKKMI